MRWTRIAMVTAAVMLLAACGDDGGLGSAATPDPTTGAATNTSATDSGSGSGSSAKCLDAAKAMASATAAVPLAMAGGAANLQQSIDQLDAFANAAPTEVRADLKTVAAGYAKVAKALKDSGYTAGQTLSPAAIQAFQKASSELDNANFRAATDRVDAWFDKECDS